MAKLVKIVIGANYGDEGKGEATAYFANIAQKENLKCLNILFNGGPQRGHTVELASGFRHVFHHFGAGTVFDADTYFDKTFMVNPMTFAEEWYELDAKNVTPHPFIHPSCRVTTPYDMMINQIVELSRDKNKHGSCGYGIWETQKRYEDGKYAYTYQQLFNLPFDEFLNYLKNIRIGEAKKLLVETDMKVHEISKAVGYEHEKHFMKTFKNITGLTPSQYRKNLT